MKKLMLACFALVLGMGSFFLFSFKEIFPFAQELGKEEYEIVERWELPKELEEVSGIEWIGNNKIACVQDEKGIIFIYNLESSKIEEEIKFNKNGDYEGIAQLNDKIYILRSDGMIIKVSNFNGSNPSSESIETTLMGKKGLDIEGLCADGKNNRLLLAVKENKEEDIDYKGIYAFDLQTRNLKKEPVYKLDLKAAIFEDINGALKKKFRPSEIEIHPNTSDIFVLDGTNPKLLVLDNDAKPKKMYKLDNDKFGKPEGLTFSDDGRLYISNEADDAPANILQVNLK